MTITLRSTKGTALTYSEMDENFRDLRFDTTLQRAATNGNTITGDISVTGNVVASGNGSVVQIQHVSAMPTAHISTVTTNEATVSLIAGIRPKFSTSRIHVHFYSTMAYGSVSPLITLLYRRINGGAYTALTPFTNTTTRYTYGWNYLGGDAWMPLNNFYVDYPGTTGLVEYVVNYRLISGSTTSYVVHQYMEYGYFLTEVA